MRSKSWLAASSLALLASCANIPQMAATEKQTGGNASGPAQGNGLLSLANSVVDIPEVPAIGVIPPPPPHVWASDSEDVNENRALNYGLVSLPVMEEYLNKLYKKAKVIAGVPDWPGKVYISADTAINAHSSAAGNIYINIAELQSAETEDEIFAVISHEFGHVYLNHQSAYRANLMTGTAMFIGRTAVALVTKNASAPVWNAADTLGAAGVLTDNTLIPNWQRSVEEEADRFGVTLSLKAGYSYPAGFKTFLERLALVERNANQKIADQKALEEQKAKQGQPQGDWAASLRKSLKESSTVLTSKLTPGGSGSVSTHDDAELREKNLTEGVRPLLKGRVRAQAVPWKEIVTNRAVSETFAHYALLPRIDELARAHKLPEAIKLANMMASGATEFDGTANATLFNLLHAENRLPLEAQLGFLLRNQKSPQRSWAVQVLAAKWMATSNLAQAKQFIEQQFEYFEKAPNTVPDMIGFYTDSLKSPMLAASLNIPCMASNPRYRQACMDRAQTDVQRHANKAKNDARTEAMGTNLGNKIGKAIGLK